MIAVDADEPDRYAAAAGRPAMRRRESLAELVHEFLRHGTSAAWVHYQGFRRRLWSYRETLELAEVVAAEMTARGIGRGERILLWGENAPQWAAVFWACALTGAVAVPLDPNTTEAFAAEVLRRTEARLLFADEARARHNLGIPVLLFDRLEELPPTRTGSAVAFAPPTRNDPLEIVFTSGTTGDPRGVVITHGNVLANLEPLEAEIARYRHYERLVHPLRFLHVVPFSHVFGQFMGLWVPGLLGAITVLPGTTHPGDLLRILRRERISVLVTVPRLLENLKEKIERDLAAEGRLEWFERELERVERMHVLRRWWRLRRVRRRLGWHFWAIVTGGASLPAELERFWSLLGCAVIQGYGLTETAALIAVQHPFALAPGSIGRPLPGRDVRISETGELLVRGESVAAGYWRQAGQLEPVAGEEGWFHTGDLAEMDAQGRLYFKGRRKNVLVTPEGMKVYPEDLEAVLKRQPVVRDAVVVGLPEDGNLVPCAVLLLRGGGASEAEAAIAEANRHLAGHQKIRHWLIWPEADFPRTPTGKPQLHRIESFARERLGSPAPAGAAQPAGELSMLLARLTGRPAERVRPEAALGRELGLSSLERVELLAALEEHYRVELDEAAVTETTTVADLERLLTAPGAPEPRLAYPYPAWALAEPVRLLRLLAGYLLWWPALLLLGWPRVSGRERLRGVRGPVLVVSNHITSIDVGFVLAALPARLRHRIAVAMEGERLAAMRHPPATAGWLRRLGWQMVYVLLVALFNVFSLPQRSGFRESFQYAGSCVDRGYSLLIFPEGGRTPDGRLQPFRPGIGLLVRGLRLPVVPVRIEGLWELKRARRRWAPPGKIRVTVGAPLEFQPELSAEEITARLEQAVATLQPPVT